ncbi:hypothetical protein MKW94_017932 [Papaver nudicaule]|uniref:DUF3444 domain-containing protein n=1 Tax=Papaver nudicaule TaxID=74823 RepID=A0AA41S372_PAPNU|nr:hypothetical protein [Papaver nudicaule]
MDVHQMKQENELLMQPPPGFAPKVSNGLERTTKAANINTEDVKADNCNKNAEEVAADDDDLSESEPESESRTVAVPDAEFYDFDRGRAEECLAADQVWAIRDDLDAMPRLYALIRKIYSPFEVKIIWLDFVSDDHNEIALETSGLPIACGKFEHGETATLDNGRNTYKIYPRKGEIWALWNVNHHQEYMYEFVEVLSDYTEDIGNMVAHVVKIVWMSSLAV